MTRNYSGYTKRTTANAIVFIAYCVGMIAGPQLFVSSQAPKHPAETGYDEGFKMMIVCWILLMILPMILRFYYQWVNKKRDASDAKDLAEGKEIYAENEEFMDLTDKQQRGFRYSL